MSIVKMTFLNLSCIIITVYEKEESEKDIESEMMLNRDSSICIGATLYLMYLYNHNSW